VHCAKVKNHISHYKFLLGIGKVQGHNLFGTNDVKALAFAFISNVLNCLGEDGDPRFLKGRTVQLRRIDITESFQLGTREEVRSWIRAAQQTVRGRRQGVSAYNEQTLYIGQGSRRKTLKIYCKGDEVKKHPISDKLSQDDVYRLTKLADDLLRVELTLRPMELKRLGLDILQAWDLDQPRRTFNHSLELLNLPENVELGLKTVQGLPPRLLGVYEAWRAGHDLRQTYKKATYYRYRSELLEYDIDITTPPRDVKVENVVPLIRYLEAVPVQAPEWAIGTPLYFDPSRKAR